MKKITNIEVLLSLLMFITLLVFGFFYNTTGDSGDSIVHYLYSHYSLTYPEFFFHHWAKPVFVLLTSPFSQFGFKGIVVFNIICVTLSTYFAALTAKELKLKNYWTVFIFILFSPLYFKLIFSGLTEYLFGFILILSIYLITKQKSILALILISFLPLIRSEGLIIIGVFGLYLIIKKQYRQIPYLVIGQFIYSIAGAFFYKDLFWVFNKIPYANIGSPYGKGGWLDFFHRLNYVIEKPIYLLLFIGCITTVVLFVRKQFKEHNDIKLVLILGSFASIFIAHAIFWAMGIFNSMGLPRVLNAIVPLIGMLSVVGLQTMTDLFYKPVYKKVIIIVVVLLVGVYPFSERNEGVVFNKNLFVLNDNNLIDEEVVPFLKNEFTDLDQRKLFFSHPYLSLALTINFFDSNQRVEIQNISTELTSESLIIWDEWFSVVEGGTSLEDLNSNPRLTYLNTFERVENDRQIKFVIFKSK